MAYFRCQHLKGLLNLGIPAIEMASEIQDIFIFIYKQFQTHKQEILKVHFYRKPRLLLSHTNHLDYG